MFQTYLCNIFTHYLPVNNGKSVTGILRNFNMTHNLCTIITSLLQLLRKQTYLSQSLQIENKIDFTNVCTAESNLAYSSASRSCKLIFLGHLKYSYYKLMTIYGTPIWQKIEKFYLFTDHLYWLVYVHVISLHRSMYESTTFRKNKWSMWKNSSVINTPQLKCIFNNFSKFN